MPQGQKEEIEMEHACQTQIMAETPHQAHRKIAAIDHPQYLTSM
jgi:hypothetical protein